MSTVTDLIDELTVHLAGFTDEVEGLQDYLRLDIKDNTRAEVNDVFVRYNHRSSIVKAALAALESLAGDGYPGDLTAEVPTDVLADLQNQRDTLAAAFNQFLPKTEAVRGTIEFTDVG